MPEVRPFMWKPAGVVDVINTGGQNLVLELASGPLRLDAGRSVQLTASALEQAPVRSLLDAGKIKVQR